MNRIINLKKQSAFNSNLVTRLDSQTSDQLVFETDNENLINSFQVDSLRNIIQVVLFVRILKSITIFIYTQYLIKFKLEIIISFIVNLI